MSKDVALDKLRNKCLLFDKTLNEIEKDFIVSGAERGEHEMKEYLNEVLCKYNTLCKVLQEIDEDLKEINTKVNGCEVIKFLNELKNKREELETSFKKQKAYLLTAKSLVEGPVDRLDGTTKILVDVINQYKKLREEYKHSYLTSDIVILRSKVLVCDEKRNSLFRRVSSIIPNLWNRTASYFSSNESSKVLSTQSHKVVSSGQAKKVKNVERVTEKKLEEAFVDYAEQNERVGIQAKRSGGRWSFL